MSDSAPGAGRETGNGIYKRSAALTGVADSYDRIEYDGIVSLDLKLGTCLRRQEKVPRDPRNKY